MESKILPLMVIASLLVLQPVSVLAAAYTLALQTDKQNYSAADTLHLTGNITPPPGPGTSVLVSVANPNKNKVYVLPSTVDGTTGSFSQNVVLGGTSSWIDGKYVINATWAPSLSSPIYFAVVSFNYTVVPVTTTSSSTTTSTASTTSSIPEFPSLPVASLTLVVVLGGFLVAQLRFGKRVTAPGTR